MSAPLSGRPALRAFPAVALAGIIGILTLAPVQAVHAAPPIHEVVVFPPQPTTADHPFIDRSCRALGITVDADITFQFTDHVTTFVNASGEPVRRHVRTTLDATIFNTLNDRAVKANAVRVVTDDLVSGDVHTRGVRFRYSAPGVGTVFLTAGDWFGHGRDDFSQVDAAGAPTGFRELCVYLAGG